MAVATPFLFVEAAVAAQVAALPAAFETTSAEVFVTALTAINTLAAMRVPAVRATVAAAVANC